jgi:predicted DNA-binding transcriptional regulator YafY
MDDRRQRMCQDHQIAREVSALEEQGMGGPRDPKIVGRIFSLLKEESLNGEQLARRMNVSERTMMRTLKHMRHELKLDIRYSRELRGYVVRDEATTVPMGYLSRNEAIALAVAAQMAQSHALPYGYALESARGRVIDLLQSQWLANISGITAPLRFSPQPSRPVESRILDHLSRAGVERRTVEMTYFTASRGARQKRLFDPYLVEFRVSDWYAVGWCHLRKAVLVFAVSRIEDLESTSLTFEVPADFEADRVFENALGAIVGKTTADVVIDFDASEARWVIERIWHPSQRHEKLADGTVRLHLRVAPTVELRKWILGYGSSAVVVSPRPLAEDIAAEHRRASRRYTRRPAGKGSRAAGKGKAT